MSYRIKSLSELPASVLRSVKEIASACRAATGPGAGGNVLFRDRLTPKADGPARQKFGNVACEVNGISFPSKWEGQRYGELLMMERQNLIKDLSVHVPFSLDVTTPAGAMVRIGCYIADAVYWRGERMLIEDSKGAATRKHPLYLWKKAHCEQQYGVEIIEVERNKPRSGVAV